MFEAVKTVVIIFEGVLSQFLNWGDDKIISLQIDFIYLFGNL